MQPSQLLGQIFGPERAGPWGWLHSVWQWLQRVDTLDVTLAAFPAAAAISAATVVADPILGPDFQQLLEDGVLSTSMLVACTCAYFRLNHMDSLSACARLCQTSVLLAVCYERHCCCWRGCRRAGRADGGHGAPTDPKVRGQLALLQNL